MIHEVDDALRSFITTDALNGGVEVAFDAPTRDWAARHSGPSINVFLYDIREDLERRDVAPRVIRNEAGQIVDRRPPPRRFKLSYLITAWTQRPEDEHRLLSALLVRFLKADALPEAVLTGSLLQSHESGIPIIMTFALPSGPERSLSDLWSALGGEMKPSLDLNVVAPLDPDRSFETGPPVIEEPLLSMNRLAPLGAPLHHRTITDLPAGSTDEDGNEQTSGELVTAGGDSPGRTLKIKRLAPE